MATRVAAKRKNGSSNKMKMVMAALAAAGAFSLLNNPSRRKGAAKMIGKAGKAAATVLAASKVVGEAPQLARMVGLTARKRSRLTSWLHS